MTILLKDTEWTVDRIKAVADFARSASEDGDVYWAAGDPFLRWFELQANVTATTTPGSAPSDVLDPGGARTICGIPLRQALRADAPAPDHEFPDLVLFCTLSDGSY